MKRIYVTISGKVQKVFFRTFVNRNAILLKLTGYIKNLIDGSVEAVFEGDHENLIQIIEICKKGPVNAIVENIQIKEGEYSAEFKEFSIV